MICCRKRLRITQVPSQSLSHFWILDLVCLSTGHCSHLGCGPVMEALSLCFPGSHSFGFWNKTRKKFIYVKWRTTERVQWRERKRERNSPSPSSLSIKPNGQGRSWPRPVARNFSWISYMRGRGPSTPCILFSHVISMMLIQIWNIWDSIRTLLGSQGCRW